MATPVFANRLRALIAVSINPGDTTITLGQTLSGQWPAIPTGGYIPCTLASGADPREVVYVTAITGSVLTVLRGQEGTAQSSFSRNATITATATTSSVLDCIKATNGAVPAVPLMLMNAARSSIVAAIGPKDTQIRILAGQGVNFPSFDAGKGWFPIVIQDQSGNWEIANVTAAANDAMTIVRAQEGTAARSFPTGATIRLSMTAAAYAALWDKQASNSALYTRDTSLVMPPTLRAKLGAPAAAGDNFLTLALGQGGYFPIFQGEQWMQLTIEDSSGNIEIVRTTGIAGDVLTVARGKDGTKALAFAAGATVEARFSTATLAALQGWTAAEEFQFEGGSGGTITPPDVSDFVLAINDITVPLAGN